MADDYTIFFSSDVHGSEKCWMKFVNAAKVYGVQALVMGGDLTGKAIVPIVKSDTGSFDMTFMGRQSHFDEGELADAEKRVRFNGMYPYVCSAEDVARMEREPEYVGEVFQRLMMEQMTRWLAVAHERLSPLGVECYVMPGNDDEVFIDDALRAQAGVVNPDMTVVPLGPYQMLSCSWVPPTPWDSPRECSEDELLQKLRHLGAQLKPDVPAIFNLHTPPYRTGIDDAPELRSDLSMVTVGGQPKMIPVGSRAVRGFIEETQPLIALHGHIHESRGKAKIGRTVCVNPGSTYGEGTLDGCIVKLRDNKVRDVRIVRG